MLQSSRIEGTVLGGESEREMHRRFQMRTAAALSAAICLTPAVASVFVCASAYAEPTQTDTQADAAGAPAANEPAGRLVTRLRPGVEIRVVGGVAEILGVAGEDGVRPRVVFEGFEAAGVRPVFDMSTIGNPELAREIGLDRYFVIEAANPEQRADLVFVGTAGLDELVEYVRYRRGMVDWSSAEPEGAFTVDDPSFDQQWGLENTGQVVDDIEGTPGVDVGALYAWMLVGSTESITVAVIDAGVSDTHPDLMGQLVAGANFSDGAMDEWQHGLNDHGTRVAGVISAVQNNGIGISGVTRGAKIMPVRVLNDLNLAFPSDAAPGVIWATDNGADIINMSFGWDEEVFGGVEVLQDAIEYAHQSGLLLVASSGNSPDIDVLFPAAFSEVMAVGATDNRDKLWLNSTTGPEISITAPGKGVLMLAANPLNPGVLYAEGNGTSFAAPLVAGAAAVIWSMHPELTNIELQALLEQTAVDLGAPGFDELYGNGRLDLLNALLSANPGGEFENPTCIGDYDNDGDIDLNDLLTFLVLFTDGNSGADVAPPFGELDFFDVLEYLNLFGTDCGENPL